MQDDLRLSFKNMVDNNKIPSVPVNALNYQGLISKKE